ncbi:MULTISPECIES: transporter substrate-binding domain-containing protein [unclassified Pseudomonas]|uniref:transporter substrate-binding domain-containing protein n=1 Tax=unclassified Pseudomonas TaxID=196821 RepID=UPI002AC8C7DC|nr:MULTISPECIES: transporter substrate-binding domain-containing protein [unclassified Pseudomonas]MEB0047325.1 transporter substrate-binding domain-containing protein [Pseudomonas sp. Dout3]MEB0096577.1 transporter substrate-binding domain-containing protein [Pseudomonas sp. DC1.2]WPX60302.1 transporter substrate-binding domain-containing protein [Pseudomonas sp. DC1.2]
MSAFFRVNLALVLLACYAVMVTPVAAAADSLRLIGRSKIEESGPKLDESDWRWLRQKGTLRLGYSRPDYPPFDIVSNVTSSLEGISADFAVLMSDLLRVKIEVRRYDSRAEVIQALKSNEVDLLGTANGYEASDPGLELSVPYAEDQPTLVTRSSETQKLAPDLAGKRVSMLYHYLPVETVQAYYPKAEIKVYPSIISAVGAVAFDQADVFLGDSISANYLINNDFLNNVQLVGFSLLESNNFSFAVARTNSRLLRVLNAALAAIPANERITIMRRWGAGASGLHASERPQFTALEQSWLDAHPRLKVVINDDFLPLTFLDNNGTFQGISADVLAKVSLRTGLKFDVQMGTSVSDLINQVKTGKADIIAAFTSSVEREAEVHFTRAYVSTPLVLVSRTDTVDVPTLVELAGKSIAIVRGNFAIDYIRTNYPTVRIVEAGNATETMEQVAQGKVDAAVLPLISARYMISHLYRNQLQVTSTVGIYPARMSFSTNRGAVELNSILEKALLSIPPEEMTEVTNRWRNEAVVNDSFWLRNRSAIIPGFFIAAALLIVALLWIANLRRLIRQRQLAELALSDQNEFMRVLLDGTPHPIYVRDRAGRLISCNSAYLDIFRTRREDLIGKTILEGRLLSSADSLSYHNEYLELMAAGESRLMDRSLTLADGRVLLNYHWMLPYRGTDGSVIGLIAGWIDISDRHRLLEQLQDAKGLAEDANKAKTTFLATMSHEIRTPMNAVIGMLELAMKKAAQGVLDRFAIEVASNAARGLLDLIGDILDIARIESGHLSLNPERANLREQVESVARIFEGLARQKRLHLLLNLDFEANRDVLIDPLRFKQILSNLLSNSIKFTTEGEVRLTLQVLSGSEPNNRNIRLIVEDTGMGISVEDQQRLFSPFVQGSNNNQSARGGSGLGLVISRTLCEMMGGELRLTSALGKGTRIEVLFNLKTLEPLVQSQAAILELAPQTQILTVLVVDDYPANRLLLSQQLGYLGHKVHDAQDGAHGLRAWRNNHFDVVITDCNMPIMNGYDLTRAIRAEELARGGPPCVIFGFTANAQPDEKGRCLDAGMDDCLFKPISLESLSLRLSSVRPNKQLTMIGDAFPSVAGVIDLTSIEQLTRGDASAMNALLRDLADSNDQDLIRLAEVSEAQDCQGLDDLAHRVKGGARIIKAWALIEACEQLEVICRESDTDYQALTLAIEELDHQMQELAATLKQHCFEA